MAPHLRFLSLAHLLLFLALTPVAIGAQNAEPHSVARQWNEALLEAIRNDFARPVVHARNLYHVSAAMYDCWSLTNRRGTPALVNNDSLPIQFWQLDYAEPAAAAEEAGQLRRLPRTAPSLRQLPRPRSHHRTL